MLTALDSPQLGLAAAEKKEEQKKFRMQETSIARSHSPEHKQGWRQGSLRRLRKSVAEGYAMHIHNPQKLIANPRQIININPETVTNIPSTDFPGHWPGESHEWSLEKFKNVTFHFQPSPKRILTEMN